MRRCPLRRPSASAVLCVALFTLSVVLPAVGQGSEIVLDDGRVLSGRLAPIPGLADDPKALLKRDGADLRLILMCHDDLRRTFVSKRAVREFREGGTGEVLEQFHVHQATPRQAPLVNNVGQVLSISPFDEFGRRVFSMQTERGPFDIIQGITVVTPLWTKVEGLKHMWDQRIATSSIPRETLTQILARQVDPTNVEQRLKVVRLYLQSERYIDAQAELEQVIADFPNRQAELEPQLTSLAQLGARRLLLEIRQRRDAGQHEMAYNLLQNFPAEGVAGETLAAVRELAQEYGQMLASREELLGSIDADVARIEEPDLRSRLAPVRDEIAAELSVATLDRLSAYRQFADDEGLTTSERLALALSGWLVGSNGATENFPVAMSMYRIRNLIRQYLAEPTKVERDRLLDEIRSQENSDPASIARLVANMRPPLDLPESNPETPLMYRLDVPAWDGGPAIEYIVQLPPAYDPYRRYPTIVTLHGAGTTPELQIDWWAGGRNEHGVRQGQATRHGYIVVAPAWGKLQQRSYEFSAREHAAVLDTLRDACRRFAVDTDRVYLSGHSMGGDAAWDIGLAHPDLWAGVLPIVARSDKYCAHYWENAQYVPFYFVGGELDGDKMVNNARDLDRYLNRGFPTTVVEYLGRGHEHFSDEILRLFDWMGRHRRDFFPKEFSTRTMRPWDNFFWWVELDDFPARVSVDPRDWPPPRGTRPMVVAATITGTNAIRVQTGANRVTLWLSPEIIDFDRRIDITVNRQKLLNLTDQLRANAEVLLEDVRTRGDRQHPFWAKIDLPSGDINLVAERE